MDLVVADLNMPKLDGESLLRELKANPVTRHIPVLIATSAVNEVRTSRLLEAGAIGVIRKPVSPAAFKQALAGWEGR